MEELLKIPVHIAIIMDGNGRWAKKRKLPRSVGHQQGAKRLEEICRAAAEMGVKYLTVYAFSTENWARPEDEIATLMKILRNYLADSIKKARDNNMRIRVIGYSEKYSAFRRGFRFQYRTEFSDCLKLWKPG